VIGLRAEYYAALGALSPNLALSRKR